mmetsp:Transcript_27051/g.36148  ORF Transcript_27051/g.36148 Transcript_27051/m.36148 type:complete len:117 (+) Transcript_27051:123-473(+)
MRWEPGENESRLRIVTQNNLDCIFEIVHHHQEKKRKLQLLSVVSIDNLHTDVKRADSKHFFMHPENLDTGHVVERLIRMNQNYKRDMRHALNLGQLPDEKSFKEFMLERIHRIDYL